MASKKRKLQDDADETGEPGELSVCKTQASSSSSSSSSGSSGDSDSDSSESDRSTSGTSNDAVIDSPADVQQPSSPPKEVQVVTKEALSPPKAVRCSVEDHLCHMHLEDELKAATHAANEMAVVDLPDGPTTVQGLYEWPARAAKVLLQDDGNMARFAKISQCKIVHHEAFAGSGSAGIAMHMSFDALTREMTKLGEKPGQAA